MTDRQIREIKLSKGGDFSTSFILDFERRWNEAIEALRSLGADLNIPLAKK